MSKVHAASFVRLFPLILAGASIVLVARPAQLDPACRALVQSGEDLWVAAPDGSKPQQITHDGEVKQFVALSPRADAVLFGNKREGRILRLSSTNGLESQAEVTTPGVLFLEEAGWAADDVVWYRARGGLTANLFEFWRVQKNDLSSRKLVGSDVGLGCAFSSRDSLACSEEFSLRVGGEEIFRLDPFRDVTARERLSLSNGGSGTTAGAAPAWRIEVRAVGADAGKPVVTANKALLAMAGPTLFAQAAGAGVEIGRAHV